ncbi:MAG: helix-turn-helix domain-containing protein [Sedimentisphaerales bacterium]|jgi:excisionase family DNA binding protein
MTEAPVKIEPLLLTVDETLQLLNIGKSSLYSALRDGRFAVKPLHFGRKVLFNRAEVESYIAAGLPNSKIWQGVKERRA